MIQSWLEAESGLPTPVYSAVRAASHCPPHTTWNVFDFPPTAVSYIQAARLTFSATRGRWSLKQQCGSFHNKTTGAVLFHEQSRSVTSFKRIRRWSRELNLEYKLLLPSFQADLQKARLLIPTKASGRRWLKVRWTVDEVFWFYVYIRKQTSCWQLKPTYTSWDPAGSERPGPSSSWRGAGCHGGRTCRLLPRATTRLHPLHTQ